MTKTTYPPTPELEKMKAVHEKSQASAVLRRYDEAKIVCEKDCAKPQHE